MAIEGGRSVAGNDGVRCIVTPLIRAKGWMKLLAVVAIGYGVLIALTIVGLVIAWLPIWVGVLLWKAVQSLETAEREGSEADAADALHRLGTLFTIYGVLTVVGLAMWVLVVIVALAGGMGGSLAAAIPRWIFT